MGREISPRLKVRQGVRLRLETQGFALPSARVVLRDKETGAERARGVDADGVADFSDFVTSGDFELRVDYAVEPEKYGGIERMDASVYGVCGDAGVDVRPVPGTSAHFRLRSPVKQPLTVRCLPPPMMVNLRPAPEEASDPVYRLSDEELAYFQDLGNAVIFIHGYNVESGRVPRRMTSVYNQSHDPHFEEDYVPAYDADIGVGVRHVRPLLRERFKNFPGNYPRWWRESGEGAWQWYLDMEHNLNRAAGLGDGGEWNWEKYTRCIGISWQGDNGRTRFKDSMVSATVSGRRLVPLLRQLMAADVKVSLITHSLGARVALTTLNILGDEGEKLENVILWQPAVADTALSPEPRVPDPEDDGDSVNDDPTPFRTGVFPSAHGAARHFLVLSSEEDNVLGRNGIFGSGSLTEWGLGLLGGVYPKHRWYMSTLPYYRGLLKGALGWDWKRPNMETDEHPSDYERRLERLDQKLRPKWRELENELREEVRAVTPPGPGLLPEYDALAPVAQHAERLTKENAEKFAERLRRHWMKGFPSSSLRPAMGAGGVEETTSDHHQLKPKLRGVSQERWLKTHSGMLVPEGLHEEERNGDTLFERIYQDEIWERYLGSSGFGHWTSGGE